MVADGDKVITGSPLVEGAKVLATSLGTRRGKKIIVFRYKAKVRSRRKTGHRQLQTRLAIKEIVTTGDKAKTGEEVSPSGA
jgi:large subunit ribosomal protein L21